MANDIARTGDGDVRIRGEAPGSPDLLPEDACVFENRLCVDAVITGIAYPEGATPQTLLARSGLSGVEEDVLVIPSGEEMIIRKFIAGGEASADGAKAEIWYQPNGDATGEIFLEAIYHNGETIPLNDLAHVVGPGNGTERVVIRRENLSGGTIESFARFSGWSI